MQFLHSIFLLDKSKCFHQWWLAPAPCGSSWTGFKLYVVFCHKSFYPTPLPLFPSPPFKFFTDLMLPLQRLSNSFSLNTFGCCSEIGLEEKWFQAENLKRGYTWALYKDWKALSCYSSCPSWKNVREWDHFLCILWTGNRPVPWYLSYPGVVRPTPRFCRIVIGSSVPLKCASTQCRKE